MAIIITTEIIATVNNNNKFEPSAYEAEFYLKSALIACFVWSICFCLVFIQPFFTNNSKLRETPRVARHTLCCCVKQRRIQNRNNVLFCFVYFDLWCVFCMKQRKNAIINQVQSQKQLMHVYLCSIIIIFDSKYTWFVSCSLPISLLELGRR